jgi:DnaJ-domain-containing protein 1
MSDDTQRTMQFILEQQVQLTATVGRLSEKVDRTADSVNALLAIAELHEREITANSEAAAANSRDIASLKDAAAANALINVVEQMISERRGGGGDRPA